MKDLVSKISEIIDLAAEMKNSQQNNAAELSLSHILKVYSCKKEWGEIFILTRPKKLDDYIKSLSGESLEKLIISLMKYDRDFATLQEGGAKRHARIMISENRHIIWVLDKIYNGGDAVRIAALAAIDEPEIIPGAPPKLSWKMTLEQLISTKTEAEIAEIKRELQKLVSRIKDDEIAYNSEYGMGHGVAAKQMAERFGFDVFNPEDFVSPNVKLRDWAVRRVVEQMVETIEELEARALSLGLSPDVIIARSAANG